jgi:undecaprenyl-diphosphatase
MVGKNPLLDDVMGILASNYFAPVAAMLVMLSAWFGTRDPTQRARNQSNLLRLGVGVLLAFGSVVLLNQAQAEWGNLWERPYVNHSEAEQAMKLLYWRLTDSSFPSNAVTGLAAAAAGLWVVDRRASVAAWALVLLWGFGRVYVGIHYPIDVVGGMVIGSLCAVLALKLLPETNRATSAVLRVARRLLLA